MFHKERVRNVDVIHLGVCFSGGVSGLVKSVGLTNGDEIILKPTPVVLVLSSKSHLENKSGEYPPQLIVLVNLDILRRSPESRT